ncbi:hypothetical protein FSPOR_3690 [Fusarium sporotrichioides]|uniref:Uncharacterized protein n=1 Tax=Fusarium sporotrichioides TaxID=5514 RepID=A0A395SFZ3_FUSSP|nr:hypothetical protein FSPOR_3690 [Fusarium sporotrichioides]
MATITTPIHSDTKLAHIPTPMSTGSSNDCAVHGLSETPHLDRLLQSRPQTELQGLADAVENLRQGDRCAKCVIQDAVAIITGFVGEIYTAKKSGKLSKGEKKALKSEVKGLAMGMKEGIRSQKKEFKSR